MTPKFNLLSGIERVMHHEPRLNLDRTAIRNSDISSVLNGDKDGRSLYPNDVFSVAKEIPSLWGTWVGVLPLSS